MQAEIIIFILTCLAVATGLVFVTYWLTRARWRTRLDVAQEAYRRQEKRTAIEAAAAAAGLSLLNEAVEFARAEKWEAGIEEGKRILAGEISEAHDQKEVLGLALSVSQRGRVRVRIVDGEGGHHLLLHSPAGYKDKAGAIEILERIEQARLVRVEDFETVEAVEDEAEGARQ